MDVRPSQASARRDEIDRIDRLSRTRALTDAESRRLEQLLYTDRYRAFAADRRAALAGAVA